MQKPLRILLVVRWPVGGIRTFIKYVYGNFPRMNCRLGLVAPNLSETICLVNDLGECIEHRCILPEHPSARMITRAVYEMMRQTRYDLVHSHGFTSAVCASIPAFATRTPHVATSHDSLQEKQFHGPSGLATRAALSSLLPLASRIHSVSQDAQAQLLRFVPVLKLLQQKLTVIPNGINVAQFAMEVPARDFRQELSLPPNAFLIGFFGRFMSPKGFPFLVDALDILLKRGNVERPPYILSFGAGGFNREEKARVARLGLSDRVVFLPFVENIATSLRGIDLVAVPSLWEACPLLPMEAFVTGVPLVGTDALGLREVLAGSPARIVPRGDATALAEALLLEMKSPSIEAVRAFSTSASVRFDVKKSAAALEEVFFSLLPEGERRAHLPSPAGES